MSIAALDIGIVQSLATIRTPSGVDFFTVITNLGGAVCVIIVVAIALFLLWNGERWQYAVGLLVSLGGSLAVSSIVKILVERPRPPLALHAIFEVDYSFPSNHATAAMALYGFLIFALWHLHAKWRFFWTPVLCALIIAIGFSRIYLGVHYPSDVLAGYAIGLFFAFIGARCTRALERIGTRSRQ